jgi:hypothetical protein
LTSLLARRNLLVGPWSTCDLLEVVTVRQQGIGGARSAVIEIADRLLLRSPSSPCWPGVGGIVSLSEARSSTLIEVFISVTTIPAAPDSGVSLAFGSGSAAWGLLLQLLLNVTALTAVAIAGLPRIGPSGSGLSDAAQDDMWCWAHTTRTQDIGG